MELIFNEIIVNQLKVDEDLIKEFLEYCRQEHESPNKDTFREWLNGTVYIGDLIEDEHSLYTLTDSQLEAYLKNNSND